MGASPGWPVRGRRCLRTREAASARKKDEMNDDTSGGRGLLGRWRRPAVALLASVAATALVAACGGGSPAGAAAAGSTNYQKAVAYAQCMRSHGVPNFPDPDSQGNFLINGQKANLPGGSVMDSADRACRHLLPNGGRMTVAQQQQALKHALKFSACMRAHGLPDFPDPSAAGGGVVMNLHGTGLSPQSPQFQAARQACRRFLPGPGGP
jgi:hypothetical protein